MVRSLSAILAHPTHAANEYANRLSVEKVGRDSRLTNFSTWIPSIPTCREAWR